MAKEGAPIVVIRRIKKVSGGGHHGGAWKVAYADFVTAMMAFFLVMWLVGATTNKQKAAISEYFKNPSPVVGKSFSPAAGPNGPGGASTSMIKLGGTLEMPKGNADKPGPKVVDLKPDPESAKKLAKELEKQRLEVLMNDLKTAIEQSQGLQPFKDQLLLDITPAGLRIQIVDKQNRPMFDIGSAALKNYTVEILRELAAFINEVPNRISISGHTDMTPYTVQASYTNWELSADRANAARRALISGGLTEDKVSYVVGLASSVLFDRTNPMAPINRRISIIVMNKESDEAATGQQSKEISLPDPDAAPPGAPAANPLASEAAPVKAAAIASQSPPTTVAASAP